MGETILDCVAASVSAATENCESVRQEDVRRFGK